jgi:uncharacterized phiE125 gp8 family phage protein
MSVTATPIAAATYPITVASLRDYLRITGTDDDTALADAIAYAVDFVERATGQRMLERAEREDFDEWPDGREMRISRVPVLSVDSVKYVTGGVETVMSSSKYTVAGDYDGIGEIRRARIVLNQNEAWPTTDDVPAAVRVYYSAGYGEAADVPASLLQAVRWLAGHVYEHREAVTDLRLAELPLGLQAVIGANEFRDAYSA